MKVIMVAYGSGTARAATRLRRALGERDFHVLRAAPWVRLPNDASVRSLVADGTGTAAIEALVRGFDPGEPVLLVHDDAHLTRRGLVTMARLLESGGDAVVPHTNDRGTPQYLGPLPSCDAADGHLDGAGDLATRRVPEARYSTMLARAALLSDIGGSIVIPGSTLLRDTIHITLAPVTAAHDGECNSLRSDDGDRPLLVGSMIVKDEEEFLADALDSMDGLVDRVELYDTGSTDRTIEIARGKGAVVTEIEWRNDFGWARNRALESCRDAEYILCLDADERVVVDDPARFRRWLRTWSHEVDGLRINVANLGDSGVYLNHLSNRISRGHSADWVGALHEQLRAHSDIPGAGPRLLIHRGLGLSHLGYMPGIQEKRNKAERNIEISRAAYEARGTFKSRLDYARSLRMADRASIEATRLFEECLAELDDPGMAEAVPHNMQSYVFGQTASIAAERDEFERAETLARAALELTPTEDTALAMMGFLLLRAGRAGELAELHDELAGRPPGQPIFALDQNHARSELFAMRAYLDVGRPDDAVRFGARAVTRGVDELDDDVRRMVVRLVKSGAHPSLLGPLLAADRRDLVLPLLVGNLPAVAISAACLTALESGAPAEELVDIGFAAGLIGGYERVDGYVPHIAPLEPPRITRLAESAARRGRLDLAERLVSALAVA